MHTTSVEIETDASGFGSTVIDVSPERIERAVPDGFDCMVGLVGAGRGTCVRVGAASPHTKITVAVTVID